MATEFPFGTAGVDTFPAQATLAAQTLGTAQHSKLHGDKGDSVKAIQQWTRPWMNARALGCKGDGTTNDAALIQALLQLAVNAGFNIHFPKGTYRCDNGTTATRVVVSFLAANGEVFITGDGAGNTVFKSNVPLGVANKALIDFTDTNNGIAPICEGFSVQGPGTFTNPNSITKTANTTGATAVMTGSGFGSYVGAKVTGAGIPTSGGGTYITKVSGTNVTLSQNLNGSGGASTTVTIAGGDPRVGGGFRVTSASRANGIYCGGWYAGYLATSEGDNAIATDHSEIMACGAQENVYGYYLQNTVGGTLDYHWYGFRCSRNQLAGVAVGDNASIGSSKMIDCHFNAQPYGFLKEGVPGQVPTQDLLFDCLVWDRIKFEGSGNFAIYDQSGRATVRSLSGFFEVHGIEVNGQKNADSITTYQANDHTRRDYTVTTMSRDATGLVTATVSPSMVTDDVNNHIAVASPLTEGTGTSTNQGTVTGTTGFSAANIGEIIIAKGVPNNVIIGAFSGSKITVVKFASTTVTEALDTTELGVDVANRGIFPASGSFWILVDDEQMNVTAGHGTGPGTFTVTRGDRGTTAATHLTAATVTEVATTTNEAAGLTIASMAFHGGWIVKSVSGSTVTWETGIQRSYGATAGSLGRIGFMRCGTIRGCPRLEIDFQNDPSTLNTYPERFMDIWEAYDTKIIPTDPEFPVNFPTVKIRTTSSTYNARKANFVCEQGGIRAWLGKCGAAVTAGRIVSPGAGGIDVRHHTGVKTIPVAGMALQTGGTAAVDLKWVWIQTDGFVDDSTHGPGLACGSPGLTEKWLVLPATAADGQVQSWDGAAPTRLVVAYSTAAVSGGRIPARLVSPFLTAV